MNASTFREEWLSAYLDGELTEEQRQMVESRLASDPSARSTLEDLNRVRQMVAKLPAWNGANLQFRLPAEEQAETTTPNTEFEDVTQSLDDAEDETEDAAPIWQPVPKPKSIPWGWLATAACLLVMVGIGSLLWNPLQPLSSTTVANAPMSGRSQSPFPQQSPGAPGTDLLSRKQPAPELPAPELPGPELPAPALLAPAEPAPEQPTPLKSEFDPAATGQKMLTQIEEPAALQQIFEPPADGPKLQDVSQVEPNQGVDQLRGRSLKLRAADGDGTDVNAADAPAPDRIADAKEAKEPERELMEAAAEAQSSANIAANVDQQLAVQLDNAMANSPSLAPTSPAQPKTAASQTEDFSLREIDAAATAGLGAANLARATPSAAPPNAAPPTGNRAASSAASSLRVVRSNAWSDDQLLASVPMTSNLLGVPSDRIRHELSLDAPSRADNPDTLPKLSEVSPRTSPVMGKDMHAAAAENVPVLLAAIDAPGPQTDELLNSLLSSGPPTPGSSQSNSTPVQSVVLFVSRAEADQLLVRLKQSGQMKSNAWWMQSTPAAGKPSEMPPPSTELAFGGAESRRFGQPPSGDQRVILLISRPPR